jgi:site-specific recombinase XerD
LLELRPTSAAKIEDVTLHTMRHTFCTRLAAAGVDVRTIQELAGHEEIETTMKYVHLVERNLHLAVRLLTAYQSQYSLRVTKTVSLLDRF